jgi:hypothetical protein
VIPITIPSHHRTIAPSHHNTITPSHQRLLLRDAVYIPPTQ